jgi:hypothetical protein
MATQIEICNSALIKLGVEPIQSLFDSSKAARLCKASYDMVRDDLLASHYWNFAMKRAELVLTDVEYPVFKFNCMYDLPEDCLRVHSLSSNVEFKIEGGKIVTDLENASALYISKETDTTKYSSIFSEAFALRLASNLAYALVQSVSLSEKMHALSDNRLRDARSFDGQEGTLDLLQEDEWLDSRIAGGFRGNVVV